MSHSGQSTHLWVSNIQRVISHSHAFADGINGCQMIFLAESYPIIKSAVTESSQSKNSLSAITH